MPTSNFLQFNPTQANQENDAAYTADPTRSGGAGVGAIWPSSSANKTLYQLSTFVTAFAQMMVGKGFSMSDADVNALALELSNIVALGGSPLPISQGGTGATSFILAGLPKVVGNLDLYTQTTSLSTTTLYTPSVAGFYWIPAAILGRSPTGTTTMAMTFSWTQSGLPMSTVYSLVLNLGGHNGAAGDGAVLYSDAGTPITVSTVWSPGGAGDNYDLHIRTLAM